MIIAGRRFRFDTKVVQFRLKPPQKRFHYYGPISETMALPVANESWLSAESKRTWQESSRPRETLKRAINTLLAALSPNDPPGMHTALAPT